MALCLAIGLSFLLYITAATQLRDHQSRFDRSVQSLVRSVATNLWHYDLAAIESQIDAYQRVWGVRKILITDQYQSNIGELGVVESAKEEDIKFPLLAEGVKKVGEIRIWTSDTTGSIFDLKLLMSYFILVYIILLSLLCFIPSIAALCISSD